MYFTPTLPNLPNHYITLPNSSISLYNQALEAYKAGNREDATQFIADAEFFSNSFSAVQFRDEFLVEAYRAFTLVASAREAYESHVRIFKMGR